MRNLIIAALAGALAGGLVGGQARAAPYEECVALIETDPARAELEAQRWVRAGGGSPARHCRALALLAQGATQRAAEMMTEIAAGDRTLPDEVRAEILVEAGEIFLGMGATGPASDAAARALTLTGDRRGPLTLAARIKADTGDWQGAVADLDGALAAGAPDAELLVLRASARMRLGDQVAARSDLMWAQELAPELPSLWLEQGKLAELTGNRNEARAAWLKAIELDPEGPIGKAAQRRLQRMDGG